MGVATARARVPSRFLCMKGPKEACTHTLYTRKGIHYKLRGNLGLLITCKDSF